MSSGQTSVCVTVSTISHHKVKVKNVVIISDLKLYPLDCSCLAHCSFEDGNYPVSTS